MVYTHGTLANYPDQVSIEDLKGVFEDHFTRGAGHLNVCDVLATPRGIQVYCPIEQVSPHESLDERFRILDSASDHLACLFDTEYETVQMADQNRYGRVYNRGKVAYLKLLRDCGVRVEQYRWGDLSDGVTFAIGHQP